MKHPRRSFLSLSAATAAGLIAWANGQSASAAYATSSPADAGGQNRLKQLSGSWSVEATTPTQGAFPVLLTFTSDGTVIGDETPAAFETSAHGNWISTGPRQAAYTFVAFIGNAEGKLSSRIKVVGTLEFDVKTDRWSGPFHVRLLDPSGQETFSDRGTFSGTRIAVETLD